MKRSYKSDFGDEKNTAYKDRNGFTPPRLTKKMKSSFNSSEKNNLHYKNESGIKLYNLLKYTLLYYSIVFVHVSLYIHTYIITY